MLATLPLTEDMDAMPEERLRLVRELPIRFFQLKLRLFTEVLSLSLPSFSSCKTDTDLLIFFICSGTEREEGEGGGRRRGRREEGGTSSTFRFISRLWSIILLSSRFGGDKTSSRLLDKGLEDICFNSNLIGLEFSPWPATDKIKSALENIAKNGLHRLHDIKKNVLIWYFQILVLNKQLHCIPKMYWLFFMKIREYLN